jgi:hypothetical protein
VTSLASSTQPQVAGISPGFAIPYVQSVFCGSKWQILIKAISDKLKRISSTLRRIDVFAGWIGRKA